MVVIGRMDLIIASYFAMEIQGRERATSGKRELRTAGSQIGLFLTDWVTAH